MEKVFVIIKHLKWYAIKNIFFIVSTMKYDYDKLNRLVMIIDPYDKVITKNIFDGNGNLIKQIDAKGYLSASSDEQRYGTIYQYDLANRLTKIVDPEIAALNDSKKFTFQYQYNTFGQRTAEINALGDKVSYEYDTAGRLIRVEDQLNISVSYGYDKAGNKLYMVDGRGKITEYIYGDFGILKAATNADQKSILYSYDLARNIAAVTDRNGNQTLYTYDNRNLLINRTVKETKGTISYSYDEVGNRIEMTDESGTSVYSYDENNQLESIKKDGILQISYTYDTLGNIESVTDKKGFRVTYTYDKSSRMENINYKGKTTVYSYDENGNRKMIAYNGHVQELYTFDRNNRLLTLVNQKTGGYIISKYEYTYDLVGRQSSKTDSYGTTNYDYDPAGRVVKVEMPGKTTVYTYDNAGNRQSMNETYTSLQPSSYIEQTTNEPVQYSIKKSEYVYSNTNTLLEIVEKMYDETEEEILEKTTSYLYDANGNELRQSVSYIQPHTMKKRQTNAANPYGDTVQGEINNLIEKVTNTFDGFNRLKKTERIKGGERVTVEYIYNGDDLRTQKITKSSKDNYTPKVVNYLYDRQHVILETDQKDNVITTYVRGMNYIGRYDNTDRLSYYLYNGHGDVVQTVSETGEVENQYDYDIFGNPILTVEIYTNAIRYAGEFYDEETGLYYLRARYYNPYIGRFISEDSYWGEDTNPLSLNLYVYCYNDPIQFVDPTGHWGVLGSITKAVTSAVTSAIKSIGSSGSSSSSKSSSSSSSSSKSSGSSNIAIGSSGSSSRSKSSSSSSGSNSNITIGSNGNSSSKSNTGIGTTIGTAIGGILGGVAGSVVGNTMGTVLDRINASINYGSAVLGKGANSNYTIGSLEQIEDIENISNNLFRGEGFQIAYAGSGPIFSTSKTGSITLFQHGVNSNGKAFDDMVVELAKKDPKFIDGGLMTLRTKDFKMKVEYSSDLKKTIAKSSELKAASEKGTKDLVQALIKSGYHVTFRTEFSNPTGTHEEQITELGEFVDKVSSKDQKVNLVGHSKGGLVSAGYTYRNSDKVDKFISIDTPYEANAVAKAAIKIADAAYEDYMRVVEDYNESPDFLKPFKSIDVLVEGKKFQTAISLASMGSQSDYHKLGGTRDLAGYTDSLSNIRDGWNEAYESGKLEDVDKHAIGVNIPALQGDLIVSIESQLGGQFLGLTTHKMDTGSIEVINMHNKRAKNNSFDGLWDKNHMEITKDPAIIEQVYNLLLDKPTSW